MHIFIELAPLGLLAAGIPLCLYVFLSLKRELHSLTRTLRLNEEHYEGMRRRLNTELEDIKIRLQEAEERTGVLVAPAPPRSGLNLNKRSQVMRMSRRGENPENIAAALSLPRKEVELLLKVQNLVLTGPGVSTS